MFSNLENDFQPCLSNFKLSSANSFSLIESKICNLGKDKYVFEIHLGYIAEAFYMLSGSNTSFFFHTSWREVVFNPLPHNHDFYHLWKRSRLKTMWENEKMLVTSIFSFSKNVFYFSPDINFNFWVRIILSSATALNLVKSDILLFGKELTLSQTSPGFYGSAVQVLKTLWEKEKLFVTSNFSFSHSVFYPFCELSVSFIKFEIVVCKLFQFGTV